MMGYGVGAAALLPPGTSPWYLLMDADFLNGNGAYQAAMVVVFLLALPVTLLLNAACGAAAAVMVAAPYQQAGGMSGSSGAVQARPSLGPVAAGSGSKAGVLGALRSGVAAVASAAQHLAAVLPALPRLWRVEASVGVRTLLYMGLALALLPAPWALPRLLMMQLALPAAVLEGAGAGSSTPVADAVGRSRALLSRPGVLRSYGWLMLGPMALLAGLRQLQGLVFSSIPVRWWSQVVEVPVALMVAFSLATLLLSRFADVVPAATLLALRASEPGAVPGCLTAKRA